MGFPCNQFNNEEPGADPEIREFYTEKYDVTFDLFSKIEVQGPNRVPLYAWLTGPENPKGPHDIRWNFQKFLVSRDGNILATYDPEVEPDDPELVSDIKDALENTGLKTVN